MSDESRDALVQASVAASELAAALALDSIDGAGIRRATKIKLQRLLAVIRECDS